MTCMEMDGMPLEEGHAVSFLWCDMDFLSKMIYQWKNYGREKNGYTFYIIQI